jgi:hypothetical protein
LSRFQKSFDQFAFAADGHAGEFFEPAAGRNLGFALKPVGQKLQLAGGDFPPADAVRQMVKQPGRKTVAADPWHGYSP